jgi:hypothetical protein
LHRESDLNSQRRHHLDDDIADSLIERTAVDGLAQTTFASLERAATA